MRVSKRVVVGVLLLGSLIAAAAGSAAGAGRSARTTPSRRPPEARFSAAPTSGIAPLSVAFTDRSLGLVWSRTWSFGDGGTSTQEDPVHVYAAGGTYTVSLTVTGPGGSTTMTREDLVAVGDPVTADFSGAPLAGDRPLEVSFTDLSSGTIDTWSWDFGDGGTSSEASPTHVFTTAGLFTVSLTASGLGGTDTRTVADYVSVVEPPPVASFTGVPPSGPAPLSVAFLDLSTGTIDTWAWDFGDGDSSSLASPTHVYATQGDYTVSLTVTGPGGSDTETRIDYVAVGEPLPVAHFDASPRSGPAPLAVDFTDLSTGTVDTWSWSFGDGGTASIASPSHTYTEPGLYAVTLTVTNSSGSDTLGRAGFVAAGGEFPGALFGMPVTRDAYPLRVRAIGDLNGDGLPDLVSFRSNNKVEVWHGDGRGFYAVAALTDLIGVAVELNSAAIGDFDGDGELDVLAAERQGPQFSGRRAFLLLADGLGGYVAGSPIDLGDTGACCGGAVQALAVADLDLDGDLDFAVANELDDTVAFLFGDGAGGFSPPTLLAVGDRPIELVLTDLDGDGLPDLLVANRAGRTVELAWNAGGGSFGTPAPVATFASDVRAFHVADIDLDTTVDLVVGLDGVGFDPASVEVLLGTGGGAFSSLPPVPAVLTESIASGDIDGDSDVDLVIGSGIQGGVGLVLYGDGAGGFSPGPTWNGGFETMALADVDGNGHPDITGGGEQGRTVLVASDGTPDVGTTSPNFTPQLVGSADLDGDGRVDVFGDNVDLVIWWNEGVGTFGDPDRIPHSGPTGFQTFHDAIVAADVDLDGALDVLGVKRPPTSPEIGVFRGHGDRTFEPEMTSVMEGINPFHMAVADVDGDSLPDVVVCAALSGSGVYKGQGDGTFALLGTVSLGINSIDLGDLDLDGDLDIVHSRDARPSDNRDVGVFLNQGDGSFAAEVKYLAYYTQSGNRSGGDVAVADLDVDGLPDVAVKIRGLANVECVVSTLRNGGAGILGSLVVHPLNDSYDSNNLLVVDLDGDLDLDFVTSASLGATLARGNGDGTFGAIEHYALPGPFSSAGGGLLALVDMDEDGDLDFITRDVLILLNRLNP